MSAAIKKLFSSLRSRVSAARSGALQGKKNHRGAEKLVLREDLRLSLKDYRRMCARLDMPTPQQIRDFALFVTEIHPWHKLLPWGPPGHPFYFYLDPHAGMQRVRTKKDDEFDVVPRDRTGFHHSWLPTDVYRERFGFLSYANNKAPGVADASGSGSVRIASDFFPYVWDSKTKHLLELPHEILEAGMYHANAFVSPRAALILPGLLRKAAPLQWPEESGGEAAIAQMRERIAYLEAKLGVEGVADGTERVPYGLDEDAIPDEVLYELTVSERMRQLDIMTGVIHRMCGLIFPNGARQMMPH